MHRPNAHLCVLRRLQQRADVIYVLPHQPPPLIAVVLKALDVVIETFLVLLVLNLEKLEIFLGLHDTA